MKKLVGGDYLLDLTPIELEESEDGETYTNITNKEIIEQLTNLKKFVPNPSMVKPVWVKLKNGETDEIVVVRGEFKVVDADEFEIVVAIDGYKLKIHIEFTQATLSDNTPIDDWYIDTNDAKYLFTSDAQNIGAISKLPVFENIVDAQGNKRFIEGEINLRESVTQITKLYGKWSLSGTHLLVVLAFSVANETAVNSQTIANINVPEWVLNKIVPLFSNNVDLKTFKAFASDNSTQDISCFMDIDNGLRLYLSNFTATNDRTCRIAFDLLIDNETPESQGE